MKYHEKIYKYLIAAVIKGYSDGIKDVAQITKKYIRKFSDNTLNHPSLFDIRWTSKDEELLSIFKKECFTVALIGEYELQEKLKELAINVQKRMPENGWKLNGKSISPQNLFSAISRQLIGNYTGGDSDKIPPAGWLRTNINTANSSAYHAAEYQRLQQVSDIYPYYKYMTRHDERVRPAHSSLHGKIFRYNDPIWKSIWPPNGWNCRCYVTPMTLEEMQAEGTYVPPVEAEHHRTEFIKTVPEEFRRNPGLEEHIFTKWAEQKFKDIPKEKAEEMKKKIEKTQNQNKDIKSNASEGSVAPYDFFSNLDNFEKLCF